jgi:hypothetical protein
MYAPVTVLADGGVWVGVWDALPWWLSMFVIFYMPITYWSVFFEEISSYAFFHFFKNWVFLLLNLAPYNINFILDYYLQIFFPIL